MTNPSWLTLRGQLSGGGADGTSPDIILGGAHPDPKYTSEYDTAFSPIGKFGDTNYVYVRAKNGGATLAIGSVSVYAARIGSVQNQSQWVGLTTRDGRNSTTISAAAGEVGATGAALIWEPGDAPPPDAPWCLIAQITGDNQPLIKVPHTVTDKAGFDTWIAGQPRMAYVVVQPPAVVPVEAPSFGWSRKVELANAEPVTLDVSLTCTQGPPGGSLAYSFDGTQIGIGKTHYQVGLAYSQSPTVPANFSSTLSVAYTPGGDDDGDAQFTLTLATESGDDGGGMSETTTTPVASYTLRFGQTRSAS